MEVGIASPQLVLDIDVELEFPRVVRRAAEFESRTAKVLTKTTRTVVRAIEDPVKAVGIPHNPPAQFERKSTVG